MYTCLHIALLNVGTSADSIRAPLCCDGFSQWAGQNKRKENKKTNFINDEKIIKSYI